MSNQPDQAIDHVLTALRDTPAPNGLEARIAHRLLQAQAAPAQSRVSQFAVILSFAKDLRNQLATATAIALAVAIPVVLHQLANWQTGNWQTENPSLTAPLGPTQATVILSELPHSRGMQSKVPPAARTATIADGLPATTPGDPDAIALAETLAPSQPTPSQPPTPQERLLLRATRPGQPIELAELEAAREPFLRATRQARDQFTFARVARSLLAPLAQAESLSSGTSSPTPQPDATPDTSSDAQPDASNPPPPSR